MSQRWIDSVAEAANMTTEEAERALLKRGIRQDRPLRPARSLIVSRIAFSGEKRGVVKGDFNFDWSGLGDGVWALASRENLVGKSTVLEVLLWCLRGELKGLQEDVLSWIETVCVNFSVDEQEFCIEFKVSNKVPSGSLSRIRAKGTGEVIDYFTSESEFAATMSEFMMDTFDLDPVTSRQGSDEEKKTIVHGWSALSGALYIGGDHKLLIGDVQWGGLPARMLQMYVGMPWATTVMQASTAKKEIDQELAMSTRSSSTAAAGRTATRARIKSALQAAKDELVCIETESISVTELEELSQELVRLTGDVVEIERCVARTDQTHNQLKETANQDERNVRELREQLIATSFFNGLQPTCCPRCETSVTKERIELEKAEFSCSLCSEPISEEQTESVNEAINAAEQRHLASNAAVLQCNTALSEQRKELREARAALQTVKNKLSTAVDSAPFRKRREAELEVARLEGALRELEDDSAEPSRPDDAALVEAALKRARLAFEAQRGDLLLRLNQEILRLGVSFGVRGLQSVKLNSNAQMRLEKGNESTSFSKLTPGERLRLRIATAIALLRVGIERGVGRHPGLLIIDSPGAEETNDNDLSMLIGELQEVAKETPGLQVLIASANASKIEAALSADRCRVAESGEYLW